MNSGQVLTGQVLFKLKKAIRLLANRAGYSIQRISPVKGQYIPNPPYDYHTFAPWYEEWFREIYADSAPRTLVSEDRAYALYMFARYAMNIEGDFAECGVLQGGSALLLAKAIGPNGERELHLFDTFEGIPHDIIRSTDGHVPGTTFPKTSAEAVRSLFRERDFVKLHVGRIPETFSAVADRRFSFVHIDVDVYESTLACMQFFYPRLAKGGILIDDDYGLPRYRLAAKKAMDEFFADKAERPISLRTGQSFIIKV